VVVHFRLRPLASDDAQKRAPQRHAAVP
jgi:hypothetical protein